VSLIKPIGKRIYKLSLGCAYLVIVLDWLGFDISLRSTTKDWLKALEIGLNKKFKAGVRVI